MGVLAGVAAVITAVSNAVQGEQQRRTTSRSLSSSREAVARTARRQREQADADRRATTVRILAGAAVLVLVASILAKRE